MEYTRCWHGFLHRLEASEMIWATVRKSNFEYSRETFYSLFRCERAGASTYKPGVCSSEGSSGGSSSPAVVVVVVVVSQYLSDPIFIQ